MVDEPTEEDRLGFVRSYGVEPVDVNTDLTFKDAATAVAEMTPIIGDAMAAKEVYDELQKEDPNYGLIAALGGAALIGAIPGIGDAAAAGIRKAVDVAKRVEVDPDAVGMLGGNIRIKPKAQEGTPTVEAAGLTDEAIDKWRKENATPEDFRKSLKGRNEELQEAAAGVEEGRVFTSTYRKLADDLRPIRKVNEVPKPATFVEAVSALNAGKRKKPMIGLNASIPDGDEVTARLDIDAYTDYDVWVPTLTHSKLKTVYKPSVILEDVTFIKPEGREPKKALGVAKGGAKAPFAVMTGKYVEASDDEAYRLAKDVFDNDDVTQVGYDPTRRGFFYDRETGEAVVQADTVIQVGHLVLARNAKKMDAEAFPFNEGGMAMEKQMEMNFSLGGIPDNTIGQDPVSGNDIPLGSTAENVRDDIPANLSEGEIVVPADVVNFHGVKLFEDLRAEAKVGYAQMAEDGRIGGSPLPTTTPNMADIDIELTLEDLEASEDMGEEEDNTVEMARGGMNFERGRGNMYSSYSAPKAPTRDRSMSAVVSRAQANRDKPKNRFESIKQQFENLFRDDDRRPTLTKKPPKSDDVRPSIAQQINFGGDYKDKEEPKPAPKKKKNPVKGAGGVRQAYTGDTEPMNVRYYDKGFFERLKENLGFDDGGLIGGEDQFNQGPFVETGTGTGLVEMREYMNDAGHRIFITFIDGVPQTEIPEGYYPVGGTGSTVVMNPADIPSNNVSGGSSGGGSGTYMPTPDGVNYRELTAEELSDMVKGQSDLKGDVITAGLGMLHPVMGLAVKFALWNQTRQVKKEIERRIVSDETTEVDKMRYQNLLELANREEPTLLDRILGRTFEKTVEQIPKPVEPDVDYSDPTLAPDQGIEAPYTPDDQTESQVTTPGVDEAESRSTFSPEIQQKIEDASATAAVKAFGTPKQKAARQRVENALAESNQRVGQDNNPNRNDDDRPTYTPAPSYTRPANDPYAEPGRPTTRRTGGGGRNKGGLAKKKTKKSK